MDNPALLLDLNLTPALANDAGVQCFSRDNASCFLCLPLGSQDLYEGDIVMFPVATCQPEKEQTRKIA